MRVDVLGADGTFPGPGGACSGFLVRHDGFSLWMDAGNGTLGRLQEHLPMSDLDAVFLSHAHPDHVADLYSFFFFKAFHPDGGEPVPVLGPAGLPEALGALLGADTRGRFTEVLRWRGLGPGETTELGPLRIETFPSLHTTENLSARITAGGRTVCYSGDTGPSDDLPRAAKGADLFICEASWQNSPDPWPPIHLTARQAGDVAARSGVGRLALTHIWPTYDLSVSREQAAGGFDGPIDLAARAGGWDV